MIVGLDHVYYWTADMDVAVVFYRDVLGLELRRRDGDAWAEFEAGDVRFALHGGRGAGIPTGGTAVFRVEDLDVARFTVEERGVRVEGTGEVEGLARFVTLRDPDGNVLQLIEYRRDAS
ncbi:MAG: VOC family protein [Actinomycetota bacterium]